MTDCCPSSKKRPESPPSPACRCQNTAPMIFMKKNRVNRLYYFGKGLAAFAAWLATYLSIEPLSHWLTYSLAGFDETSHWGNAIEFFLYDTMKILLLLVFMVYAISWLRTGIRTERILDWLAGKKRITGYFLAAVFGAVTPFCSCSSVPLFIGFSTAGLPIGITATFLITSPLINEIAIVLLWELLGWKFTAIYLVTGLLSGITGGILMDTLRAGRWLQPFLLDSPKTGPTPAATGSSLSTRHAGLAERHAFASFETRNIFRRVWLWFVIVVAIGATLHGFVPQEWFSGHFGAGQWWTVPLAVVAGIPLYANVTGIIPVMESLLSKGLPAGTVLAFCLATVAASLPEILMLRQVMRPRLLTLFLGLLMIIFTLTGWLLNFSQLFI